MRNGRIHLGERLSAISRTSIETALYLAVFFLPFSVSLTEICLSTALVLWILRKWPWDEPFLRLPGQTTSHLILMGAVLLSVLWADPGHTMVSLRGVLKWIKYLGVVYLTFDLFHDSARRKRWLAAWLTMSALLCLDALFQMVTGHDLVQGNSVDLPGRLVRLQGPLKSPNDLAAFLLTSLPLLFWLWLRERVWNLKSLLLASLLVLEGLIFLMTLSRGAFLALCLAAALAAIRQRQTRVWLAAAGLFAVLMAASGLLFTNFILSLNLQDITVGERLTLWTSVWAAITQAPWFGRGVNTFVATFSSVLPSGERYVGYAHNCYLQLWYETGLVGLAAFLVPFLRGLTRPLSDNGPEAGLKSALWTGVTASLLQSAVDTNLYGFQTAIAFWLVWGFYSAVTLRGSSTLPHALKTR